MDAPLEYIFDCLKARKFFDKLVETRQSSVVGFPFVQPNLLNVDFSSRNNRPAIRGKADRVIDYSSTKGAIVAFTRSLSKSLIEKGIRVNGVAPGPIWTPLIPSTFPDEKVESFGDQVPMHRAGQPEEIAPSYVFLASDDSSYFSGQILHPNGGEVVNS